MKHYFFCAFLSLFLLSGCGGSSGGGGGSSTSSSKKAKAAKACTTPILNGKGELPWNTKTKKYSTTCKVVSCNAGYDNVANPAQCGKTQAGYYSLAKDKTRKKCLTTFPPHSLRNTATGTKSETDCWKCKSGSLKNTSNKKCTLPTKGKYYNAKGELRPCRNVVGTPAKGFKSWENNTAPVASNDKCEFSCNKSRPCSVNPIANGGGLQLWDTKTNDFSTTCTVETCDAGFDNTQAPTTQCQQTAANFYSPANDKTRTACSAPGNSSPITTTGLHNPQGCFNCTAGYWENPQGSGSCDVPDLGKWVDATNNSKKDCTPISNANFNTWLAGVADAANKCPFSCNNNLIADTQGRSCVATTRSCSSVPNGSGTQNWETQNNRYGTCTVETCNAGFVKSDRACNTPDTGKYADNGVEKDCSPITGDTDGFDDFDVNTGAVSAADGCGFSCNAGFVKSGRTCKIPDQGKYAEGAGAMQSCSPPTGATGGFNTFLRNTGAVDSATGCRFSCNAGFVKISADRTCAIPDTGKYADSSGDEQTCNNPTGAASGFDVFLPNTGAVSTATGCGFSCKSGYVKDAPGRTCNFPSTGSFVNAQGTEVSCDSITSITTEGTATATWIAGAASAANTCPFSCSAGYLVDSSARECKYPTLGHYADAQGAEDSCTDITSITGFGSWLQGAATDADSCPFSCSSGYTISVRTCRKAIPKMLALGKNTSRVLFDNGEVEAWGAVSSSASLWRTHIKKNLGINTPQDFVSGRHHQCIILENAGQNHGRLMCWGSNSYRQLGVGGGTNPRSTPAAVTATVLGDAGGGTPKTVKSVAVGGDHTCAILSDDTVVCWGKNNYGQIGGGTSGSFRVLSGTVGDPLIGGTASRIAAGVEHTCAILTTDSSVKCWGSDGSGRSGGGTPSLGTNKTATEIAASEYSFCAILNDGGVKCWGLDSPNLGSNTATKITVGHWYGCVLLNDKTVKCWGGGNSYGRRGGGTSGPDRVLRGTVDNPLGGETAIQIAAGHEHTCAIMESDNSVKCWGRNIDSYNIGFYGQIVGEVPMTGGSDGTGTSTGETATLTAASAQTATSLDSDASGKICKIELSGGPLGSPWVAKNYTRPLTYNAGGSTTISDVIDSLITAIGSTVKLEKTDVTLSREGNDKIAATVNSAVFDGHDFNYLPRR